MTLNIKFLLALLAVFITINFSACKKLVQVPEPENSITNTEVFSTAGTATSALIAIYSDLTSSNFGFGNGTTTELAGLSADELLYFQSDPYYDQIQNNKLNATNNVYITQLWHAYFDIYMANGVINGLQASNTISAAVKNQLIGEAKFLRAFSYFYLINFYGTPPLVTTTDFNQTASLSNATSQQIYQQIISDLQASQGLLPGDYSASNGERVRANKWAATALLARVYLYQGDWADATKQASSVISNTATYSLVSNLNNVFLANSTEAILQLIPNSTSFYSTGDAINFIPLPPNTGNPTYYLTTQLLSAFENGDQRRLAWVDSTQYSGTTYYYPFKYKVFQGQASQSNISEYYMLLRLSEQYLIRAEAEANNNDSGDAINDLNVIRNRAGLPNYKGTSTKSDVLNAIYHERQVELFAEWGHRWFDLKRTGRADSVLSIISYKKPWSNNALLYPIPYSELVTDPNLKQNPGY